MALRNNLLILLSLIVTILGILTCFVSLLIASLHHLIISFLGFAVFALGVYMFFYSWEKRDKKQREKRRWAEAILLLGRHTGVSAHQ